MSGKGSKQRPTDRKKFDENYDRIFGKKQEPFTDSKGVVHENCGTSNCCGNCRKEREAAKRIPNR